jgi:hypothetical protein
MHARFTRMLCAALTLSLSACGRLPAARSDAGAVAPDSMRAVVESVHTVHQVAPGDTLRVRLRGTVGADGSWAADGVDVRRERDRVVLVPRVKRVPGSVFIQMVIPLDVTVPLVLAPGDWTLEVHGREAEPQRQSLVVRAGAEPPLAVVELTSQPAIAVDGGAMLPVRARARIADGWVQRLEVRGFGADPGVWRDPGTAISEGTALSADFGVLRPLGDPARRIEARAVDGQGRASATATLELPARSE